MTEVNPEQLASFIKSEARRSGFDLVGITTPEPPPHLDVYRAWLDQGRHGEMGYLATERAREHRQNPRLLLPECESILVVAASHHPPPGLVGAEGPIAAYALGEDYHRVLLKRLEQLVAALEARSGASIPHRIYTDTGPLLERELAQRAGLGWIGKNTCLIHPRLGSYFFLAEVLLGIALDPDPPLVADHCGSCTRCIEACPTRCILPDRTLDARRCISYLTIELRGAIPIDLRPEMGGWIFGCDICQQACPWNIRFAHPTSDPAFQPTMRLPLDGPGQVLAWDEETFQQRTKGSPIRRARRSGLARNTAVAAGNSGDRAAIPPLAACLVGDGEGMVRRHAAWALGRIGGGDARRLLREAAGKERDPDVLAEIQSALAESDAEQG